MRDDLEKIMEKVEQAEIEFMKSAIQKQIKEKFNVNIDDAGEKSLRIIVHYLIDLISESLVGLRKYKAIKTQNSSSN